ncbi:hypothetical protein [Nocardia sp. NPDC049526]|uniref:hypothetical protein n=1 Tax=Nocardia sp. NPDC049526 TaxID=3364316 RepID=UPI0037B79118
MSEPVSGYLLCCDPEQVASDSIPEVVVAAAGERARAKLIGPEYYGCYNTMVGIGILAGNLATGAVIGAARAAGVDWACGPGSS